MKTDVYKPKDWLKSTNYLHRVVEMLHESTRRHFLHRKFELNYFEKG